MPPTLRLRAESPGDLARAAEILRSGGTVAFPTETVYGLGANALDQAAVAAIFAAKQRPSWDPLIVHLADPAQLDAITEISPLLAPRVELLTRTLWPGPLTLLLPRSAAISDGVTAGRPLVGVRIPNHDVALELLRLAGVPVAAPSANTFGHTSPTTAQHVLDDLDGRIDAVLDGGATSVGVESTVLDPATMVVYRPGAVTLDQLTALVGVPATLYVPSGSHTARESLPSPGVGIRHYAPRARLVLMEVSAPVERSLLAGTALAERPGVMLPDGWAAPASVETFAWGAWDDLETLGRNLFAGLRALDDAGVAVILCPVPRGAGFGEALRDRLEKAARSEESGFREVSIRDEREAGPSLRSG